MSPSCRIARIASAVVGVSGVLLLGSCRSTYTGPVFGDPESAEIIGPAEGKVLVHVESNPIGAIVRVNSLRRGRTPVDLLIDTTQEGAVMNDLTISADYTTNVRASGALGAARVVASYQTGEMLPSRLYFDGAVVRNVGRALTLEQ